MEANNAFDSFIGKMTKIDPTTEAQHNGVRMDDLFSAPNNDPMGYIPMSAPCSLLCTTCLRIAQIEVSMLTGSHTRNRKEG
jgi:hypothetical protein